MKRIALIWPPQKIVVESLFRHYNCLAEVAGYLEKSRIFLENGIEVVIYDCGVSTYSMKSISEFIKKTDVLFVCINMNNIIDALDFIKLIRSFDSEKMIIGYGEGICCNPDFFAKQTSLNYVIGTGKYELSIEFLTALYYKLPIMYLNSVLQKEGAFSLDNKIFYINEGIELPSEEWGIPNIELLPVEDYIKIGNGELHITACKGCPYTCKFCNEKYVSSMRLQYRPIKQIVDYIRKYHSKFKSIYLDSSTFTFDRNWALAFCDEMIKISEGERLPWKTCTRLDCIDEELVKKMAEAGCIRISIGVESLDINIQNENNKIVNIEKLFAFRDWCVKYGIVPRLLFIIGLEKDAVNNIKNNLNKLRNCGFDLRFRILQDFQFLLEMQPNDISQEMLKTIDRINIPPFIQEQDINYCRNLEYLSIN